jgi:hypothetical protein
VDGGFLSFSMAWPGPPTSRPLPAGHGLLVAALASSWRTAIHPRRVKRTPRMTWRDRQEPHWQRKQERDQERARQRQRAERYRQAIKATVGKAEGSGGATGKAET